MPVAAWHLARSFFAQHGEMVSYFDRPLANVNSQIMWNLESLEAPSTSQSRLSFRLRGGRGLAASGWLVWLPIALALTWKPYRNHFAHFRIESILWMALLTLAAVVACHYLMRWPIVRASALPVLAGSGLTGLLIFEPRATLVTLTVLLACYGGGRFVRACRRPRGRKR